MQTAAYITLSNQLATQRQIETIANNIANSSTTAFKGERVMFQEFLIPSGNGQTASYVHDVGTTRDTRQGPITRTSNPLDVALNGGGYLSVQTPEGQRFTRNGRMHLNPQGEIVTSEGYTVLGEGNSPLTIPGGSDKVSIGQDGTVAAGQARIGKLQVVKFDRPQAMTPAGAGLYQTDETPQPATDTKVEQSSLEESNVQTVLEITRLMELTRNSGISKDFLDGESDRLKNAIEKLGKVV